MHFAKILSFAVGAAAVPAFNLPIEIRDAVASADPDIASSLISAAGLAWSKGKQKGWPRPRSCSLSKATLPSFSGDALPAPAGTLAHVLIGRGTQNYTCDTANPSSAPVAAGALASLYDAGCVASRLSPFLPYLPMLALLAPNPKQSDDSDFLHMDLIGRHYFVDAKSPVFNLQTKNGNEGYAQVSKASSANAPANAMAGAHGACSWLYLSRNQDVAIASGEKTYSGVYRVNTAGGNAPATCQGQPAAFEVEYAAEYWLYQ
ncbi:hypothetical protein FH972_026884 [Carpinus fangiana]|uniref:Malate dehydrogenase n=1 Tax=Carpinus fangiana TaxID=176857 RepID=A0A5N6L5D8_9ROSI|nr:hypothetical protein FH972_026884 [Carpinus fangiana]